MTLQEELEKTIAPFTFDGGGASGAADAVIDVVERRLLSRKTIVKAITAVGNIRFFDAAECAIITAWQAARNGG